MSKCSVGIDVTAKDVKMVCLTQKAGQVHLADYAVAPLTDPESVKKALLHPAIHRGTTRYSIHDGTIKIRKITVPIVPKQELDEVIRWALKDATKTSVEGHTIRYYPVGGAGDKQQSYLAMAVEQKKIQDHVIELQKIGVGQPQLIEPSAQALANCVGHNYELKLTDRCAAIHLDPYLAYYTVVSPEGLLFYRTFSRIDGNTRTDLSQFFSKLTVEIQYSCENYLAQFPNQPITQAILSGEEAALPGLKAHIEETLQVPTQQLEVFKKIELSEQQRAGLGDSAISHCIAVGLAL